MAGDIKKAGEWSLEFMELTASSGRKVRLDDAFIGITFIEDINNNSLTGTLTLSDAINLASYAPILGQEYLKLELGTPLSSGKGAETQFSFMKNALMVTQIGGRQDVGNGVQGYQLEFCTRELLVNQRTKVNQSFVGTWSDIVTKIMTDKLGCRKKIKIEPSNGSKKYIAPNIRPFDVIQVAENEAKSKKTGEATYYFFETKEAYHFRSLASLYAEPAKMVYENAIAGKKSDRGIVNVTEDMKSILAYTISGSADSTMMQRTGAYSSQLISHDISSKSYQTYTYNMLDQFSNNSTIERTNAEYAQEGGKITDYPTVSELEIEPGKRVSDYPARTFLTATSGRDASDIYTTPTGFAYQSSNQEGWLQERDAVGTRLDNTLTVAIRVHGNTFIHAGDVVVCNLPYTAANKTAENERYDNIYKGKFLVSALRHDFLGGADMTHTIQMKLVKDSLQEPIGVEDEQNYEPVSIEEADIQSDFYGEE
jgi:hypothetical protein